MVVLGLISGFAITPLFQQLRYLLHVGSTEQSVLLTALSASYCRTNALLDLNEKFAVIA